MKTMKITDEKKIAIYPLVLNDLADRVRKGEAEYGAVLTAETGINGLWEAYEEVLDMAMYLRHEIEKQRIAKTAIKEAT